AASGSFATGRITEQTYGKIEMGVDSIDVVGPFDSKAPEETLSRRQVFLCRPAAGKDEESCAKRILSTVARRAYRRPVTEKDVQTLLRFYNAGRTTGTLDAA